MVENFYGSVVVQRRMVPVMRGRRGRALAILLAACGGQASSPASKAMPLPSDGWRPGDPPMLALTAGPFHAVMTAQGRCAWLGTAHQTTFLWPAGYEVRFHPVELIDVSGNVVATDGEKGLRGRRMATGISHNPVSRDGTGNVVRPVGQGPTRGP